MSVDGRDRETLSVAIPTKNAGHLLRDCLASVAFADEIIVVDMFSTDDTQAVCAEYPQCRLIQREDYIFANVNFAFEQASGDWVLRIDTDERLTPELSAEVQQILDDPPPDVTGFEFWERPLILGHELKFGFGRKHYRKCLFRRGRARYPVQHEHEDLETSGTWLRTRHGYLHLNYPNVSDYLKKMDYYTDRDAERAVLAKRPKPTGAALEATRQFYLYYVKYQGFRDGWVGFLDAGMRAGYQFVYWAKLRQRWERDREAAYGH
jgi:glycosyltransferase involved in cell wall biosynthesis